MLNDYLVAEVWVGEILTPECSPAFYIQKTAAVKILLRKGYPKEKCPKV